RRQAAAQGAGDAVARESGRAHGPAGGIRAARRRVSPARSDAGRDRRGHRRRDRGGGGGVLRARAADDRPAGAGPIGEARRRGRIHHRATNLRGPMLIGVPKEIKTNENRIALVPAGAEALGAAGHMVFIEAGAGLGSGFPDDAYTAVGATILASAEEVWQRAEMIMKVKEPIAAEWARMRRGQVIYTYFHFAAAEDLTRAVIDSGAVAVAYETVQLPSGELPLLTPMSEVAGRMAVQEGAKYLEKVFGGSGVLLGGVPGVAPGEVVIIGGGVVGINAAKMAAGLGAHVTILDISLDRLRYLDDVLPANVD